MKLTFRIATATFEGDVAELNIPDNATIHEVTNDATRVWVTYSTTTHPAPRKAKVTK